MSADTFTVTALDWHGRTRRRLVFAADAAEALEVYQIEYPHRPILSVTEVEA